MSSEDIITRAYDKLMGAGERALADELVEFSSAPHSRAPKLIVGLILWNPGAEYDIEYRSLEFWGPLSEKINAHTQLPAEDREYANARLFVVAVPGDLNDEGIVKYLDARVNTLSTGDDIWTTGLNLTQA